MSPPPPSRSVHIGYRLSNALLWFAVAFGVLALASICVGVARHGNSLLYGRTLSVPLQLNPAEIGPLPPAVHLSGWPDVGVDVKDPTTKQMFLRSAQDLGLIALMIAALWQLRGFARSVVDGDPFGAPNVARLRRLGFLLVVVAPLLELFNSALRSSLFNALPMERYGDVSVAGFSLPAGAMLGGLGAFILAEVFAYGMRLREDVEATV
jgi:hypothetical protein